MTKYRRWCAGLLAAAAVIAVSAGAVPPALAVAPVEGAVFNDPRADEPTQRQIFRHLQGLIEGAPAGSTIQMAMYHFEEPTIAATLLNAKSRGVSVRVVLDWEAAATYATDSLVKGLGTDVSQNSWVHICTSRGACIGKDGEPINHNKFFLFSSTSGADEVVVQTSSNLTGRNALLYWNNAVTLVGNSDIYKFYEKYFNDLVAMRKTNNYYQFKGSGNAKAYFFPRAGTDRSTDTIHNILNENVACEGNTTVGTSDQHRTIIRVAMWIFTRAAVAQKLRDLADEKCWIDVIYSTIDKDTLAALSGHDRIKLYRIPGPYIVHSKYMLIEGTYLGKKDSKWVFTGSHNYTNAALRENDEALLRIESEPIHDQFRANFRLMRSTVG